MIKKLDQYYDVLRISEYFESIKNNGNYGQVSLSYRPDQLPYIDGCGSTYKNNSWAEKNFHENEFTEIVQSVENPIYDIIDDVRHLARTDYSLNIGRIRFMTLLPKTCLSYHKDDEEIRFHIPVVTNHKCFFIIDDQVFRMEKPGQLYTLKTDCFHTPVNADINLHRTHLVFSTYKI